MHCLGASAVLVGLWWLAVPAAAQEPAEPPPEASPTPKVLLPLKDRQGPTVVLQRSRARMYQVSSSAAWEALQGLIKDLGLGVASRDKEGQVLATSWQSLSGQRANGLEPQALDVGVQAGEFQLHLFVSPFAEPAHVYVDAVARNGRAALQPWTQYAFEPIGLWFFSRLAERLGEEGRPIPRGSFLDNAAPDHSDAAARCSSGSPVTPGPPRQAAKVLSKPHPIFPSRDLARGGTSKVLVEALVGADGAVHHVRVEDAPADSRLALAAASAVSLWRYEPARFLGCPVPRMVTVTVSFRGRR